MPIAVDHTSSKTHIVAAHRGLRFNGIPENSKASVLNAAKHGLTVVEIDIRLTNDGHLIVFHDEGLGRATNIGECFKRSDVYSPFTGKGFNPQVKDLPWKGCVEHLKLKEEHGRVCREGVLEFWDLLDFIRDQQLNVVVMMDIKDRNAIAPCFEEIKHRYNAAGIHALEWCVWKLDCTFYPLVQDLEREEWFRESLEICPVSYIPVYEPVASATIDAMASIQSFATRDYVVAFEIGLRSENGQLQDVLDFARSEAGAGRSIGYFAALGDLQRWDGQPIKYKVGQFSQPWDIEAQQSRYCFYEGRPLVAYDELILPHESKDGHDYRHDLKLYKSLGYSWTIADFGDEIGSS